MSINTIIRQEARLILLRALAEQPGWSLNESLLAVTLETFGITRPRAWVRDELRYLETLGAATVTAAGTVLIATLTDKGRDHVEGRFLIEGVKRPGPRS